jgi:hypothetical protein
MHTKITIHTRRTTYGFTGYIQLVDGPMRRSRSTHIVSLTREDALANAQRLRADVQSTGSLPIVPRNKQ